MLEWFRHRKVNFVIPFERRFPLIFFNENYIAGEKIDDNDQTELDSALTMPEMDSPLHSA